MSSQIPYQLRPNKYVDRALFMDLLNRATLFRGPESYVYISMGGKHLVDHKLVYQRVGIENGVSFDGDQGIIDRQRFNAPGSATLLECMMSSEISHLLQTLDDLYTPVPNYVVWLDYTSGRERKSQVDEFLGLLVAARPYDIFRLSMSAEASSLDYNAKEVAKRFNLKRQIHIRLAELKIQLGEWVPSTVHGISDENFGSVLIDCIRLIASEAERRVRTLSFRPLLLTEYADGAKMVTVCLLAIPRGDEANVARAPSLAGWEHLSQDWSDIHYIRVPDLSIKEKELLDSKSGSSAADLCEKIGFEIDVNRKRSIASVISYWKYRKYYPTFRAVEV